MSGTYSNYCPQVGVVDGRGLCYSVYCAGAKLLKEMLLFCKEKSQVKEPYEELESFVLCGSPSKTVYLLEV